MAQTSEQNAAHPVRYAFIDVQNTEGTASQMLGFVIDWHKLYRHLKDHWNCKEVFFYSGIQDGNEEKATEYSSLKDLGYTMSIKPYKIYRNPDRIAKIVCSKCANRIDYKMEGGVRWKSNCDAELSVDATNLAGPGVEFLMITGDGDFEYVVRNAVEKGTKVYIISSPKKIKVAPRYFRSRFSSKLRDLIAEKPESVFFFNLNDWKMRVQKSI